MALLLDTTAAYRPAVGLLSVGGVDRLTYLNSLLSQQFEGAAAGTVADFLYLDAKGTVQATGRATVRDDTVVLAAPADIVGFLADALQKFTFLLDAPTRDISAEWTVAAIRGRGTVDVEFAPTDPMTARDLGDGVAIRDRSGGVDLAGSAGWVEEQLTALGLPQATDDDWEAWRITHGLPAWGAEIVEGRRAQELGLLPTHVHLRKGCYPGQESIAKIYNLGRPRRALSLVEFAGPVAAGDPVSVGDKTGEITSATASGAVWVALALLPVPPDGEVVGDGSVAAGDVVGRVRHRVGAELAIPGA